MKKLSTGQDSTLANYRSLAVLVFGPKSESVKWIDEKIYNSPTGDKAEVLADEVQMLVVMRSLEGLNKGVKGEAVRAYANARRR